MNEDFVNVYVDVMNKKIEELTRNEIMLQARLAISEKMIAGLQSELTKIQNESEKTQASLNKKASKTKEDDF